MATSSQTNQGQVVLEVEGLQTYFQTRWGTVKAVDGVSFDLRRGETLGIVGESGSGKSVTMLSLMRLIPEPPGRIVGGRIVLEGEDLLQLTENEMSKYRGSKIALIIQDPMTSLNPVFSIGNQVGEAIKIHQDIPQARRAATGAGRTAQGEYTGGGDQGTRLSAPDERRDAAAGRGSHRHLL